MQHYEERALVPARAEDVFAYVDDQSHLSSHMSQSSWAMGGGRMEISVDAGRGQAVGSRMRLSGRVLGVELFLEQVVTHRQPPRSKAWETIGNPKLLVIGNYRMGLEITPQSEASMLRVSIDYELPAALSTRWLGYLFGGVYAKWCVRQMVHGAREHFAASRDIAG